MERNVAYPIFVITLDSFVKNDWVDFIIYNDYIDVEKNHRFDDKYIFQKLNQSGILSILKLYSQNHILIYVNTKNFTSMKITIDIQKKCCKYSKLMEFFTE